ncbi:hypothetical protein [Kiloniella litopenaei]|uniref:hypothetical protein n=1 Tax=Kiloniella litopenaei TaxID=1549748 RepID=UPI000696347D|nr:hypothetical protein [Kiloniella litopenaei]
MTDPAQWLNMHFEGWSNLTPQEKKAIRDFPILWSIFELQATGQNGERPNATPERICRAIENLTADIDENGIQQAKHYFSGRYYNDNGQGTYAFDQLRVHSDYQQYVRNALLEVDVSSQNILLGLLLIINRLRNNFLHGEKASYAFANQLENFRHANSVLMFAIPLWDTP